MQYGELSDKEIGIYTAATIASLLLTGARKNTWAFLHDDSGMKIPLILGLDIRMFSNKKAYKMCISGCEEYTTTGSHPKLKAIIYALARNPPGNWSNPCRHTAIDTLSDMCVMMAENRLTTNILITLSIDLAGEQNMQYANALIDRVFYVASNYAAERRKKQDTRTAKSVVQKCNTLVRFVYRGINSQYHMLKEEVERANIPHSADAYRYFAYIGKQLGFVEDMRSMLVNSRDRVISTNL
jgi:hypothetical protein